MIVEWMTAIVAALTMSSADGVPDAGVDAGHAKAWRCENQVEVWCAVDGCAARPVGEMTPLSISLSEGVLSVCAYSGCWEGPAIDHGDAAGRHLFTADKAPFSSTISGGATDLTLLIDSRDGVGFVRAGGIATPLLCQAVSSG